MSEKLPRITGKQLLTALATFHFEVVRVRGSHHFLRHQDGRTMVVPVQSPYSGELIDDVPAASDQQVETALAAD